MLKNKKLLLDKDCPMCRLYGQCFIQMKLIDKNTLDPYQTISSEYTAEIDMERAKNEIALYDEQNHTTEYGIDAFIAIIAQKRKLLAAFLKSPVVYFFLWRLYRFISYNRKLIAPAQGEWNTRDCTPDVNYTYRWAYIIIVAILTGIILNRFTFYLFPQIGFQYHWYQELLICIGQVIWQGAALTLLYYSKSLDYLGNMSTVSMIGGLLLLPLLIAGQWLSLSAPLLVGYFGFVVGIMLMEHIRRCGLLELPLLVTCSWIAYRGSILLLIFKLAA